MQRISTHLTAAALLAGCWAASSASATPTILYQGGQAVGVQDLVVDGIAYDVNLVKSSYNTLFASSAPLFLGNQAGANLAATAMRDLFNAEAVPHNIGGNDPAGAPIAVTLVPYLDSYDSPPAGSPDDYFISATFGYQSGYTGWVRQPPYVVGKDETRFDYFVFAVFDVAEVPEPGELALAGLGLACLGFTRRRASRPGRA